MICKEGQGIVGDTVKLVNDKTYLTLCEVRVWGPKEAVVIDIPDVEVIGGMSDAADDAVSIAGCSAGQVLFPFFIFILFYIVLCFFLYIIKQSMPSLFLGTTSNFAKI